MLRQLRTLLVLGAMCWVAPLGAEPSTDSTTTWSDHDSGCPYARARAEAAAEVEAAQARPAVVVKAEAPLLDHRGPAAALLP